MRVVVTSVVLFSVIIALSLNLTLVESFSPSTSSPKRQSYSAVVVVAVSGDPSTSNCARSKKTLLGNSNSQHAAEDSSSDGSSSSSSSHRPHRSSSSEQKSAAAAADNEYATGAQLKQLRSDLANFREILQRSMASLDEDDGDDDDDDNQDGKVEALTKAIAEAEARDPDIAYARMLAEIKHLKTRTDLTAEEKDGQQELLQEKASHVRSLLPQFNLDGLWVGNYGKHGVQLVNVTYNGDTLMATKTTGDINVPRGQVSFTADLSPSLSPNSTLEPLKVSFEKSSSSSTSNKNKKNHVAAAAAAAKTSFPRYAGLGQVAKPGFVDNKHVDGQLILLENHFSFVWMPPMPNQRHHVIFRRPTPEQTISLLRNVLSREDELQNMREHLARCLDMDMTESLARQCAGQATEEPFRRIASQQDLEQWEQAQKKEAAAGRDFVRGKGSASNEEKAWKFWQVHKWKQYIYKVLGEHDQEYN